MKARALMSPLILLAMTPMLAQADLQTEEIHYRVGDEQFTGYLAYDDRTRGERPGILIVHEWWGHNEFSRQQAEKLATEGYTAFALDMYGSGKLADHPDDARRFMQAATENSAAIRERFEAAMQLLQDHATVDADRIAAQGYCFGGAVVLNMARMGLDLAGVVSIHGPLASPLHAEPGQVKARVQVYTGGADQMVPADQVAALVQEMQSAGVDLTLTSFPGVKHSFSNPDADAVATRFGMPIGYDRQAAERTWRGTLAFYHDLFDR